MCVLSLKRENGHMTSIKIQNSLVFSKASSQIPQFHSIVSSDKAMIMQKFPSVSNFVFSSWLQIRPTHPAECLLESETFTLLARIHWIGKCGMSS